MHHLRDIINRLRAGESERRIAHDLKLSRPTVHKYKEWAAGQGYLQPGAALPENAELLAQLGPVSVPPATTSTLVPYQATVERLLEQGVELTAIWQRLQENHGYSGSYSAVRRFVKRLRPVTPEVFVRVQTAPGEEMQVDFGNVGQLFDPVTGRLRSAYVFVATLGYSRHQYAELVFDQKIPTWLALHRRAFESFGGVPARVVPDNLKAAVIQALVHDPVLGEAYRRQALHYDFLISPTIPGTPRHKGKVENGVHYVQRNFMAGQEFVDILTANQRLGVWVRETAGSRSHGTTRQAPLSLFAAYEQAALQPLPPSPLTLHQIKLVKVHPDCHITLDGSYYSVPWAYVGQKLEAYVSEQLVELYQGVNLVATHLRCLQPGQWQSRLEHYPPEKAAYLIQTPVYCRHQATLIGPASRTVADTLLAERPLDRLRAVQSILRLADSVGPQRLEAACARALHFGDVRYRRIKLILNAALDRDPLPQETPAPDPAPAFTFARPGTDFFPPAETPPC
ncbi:MAG TPA: IS21 family transposase [Anaerolineae bacterium]